MEPKIYVGSGKTRTLSEKQSEFLLFNANISISPDKLKDYIKEYEGKKYVKLNIQGFKKPDQYGKNVSITVDTYEPQAQMSEEEIKKALGVDELKA